MLPFERLAKLVLHSLHKAVKCFRRNIESATDVVQHLLIGGRPSDVYHYGYLQSIDNRDATGCRAKAMSNDGIQRTHDQPASPH